MSFRCEACGTAQSPRTKEVRLPIEFRPRSVRSEMEIVETWEIAREAKLCPSCVVEIKPRVDGVKNRELQGIELEVTVEALRSIGRPC